RLGDEDRRRKQEAVLSYRSQTAVMKRFLTSFIRQDELFGTLPEAKLAPLGAPSLTAAGMPRDWSHGSARMIEARQDTLLRRLDPAADLESLEALADDDQVYLRLSGRAPLSERIEYRFYLHPIAAGDAGAGPPLTLRLRHDDEAKVGAKSVV